MSDYFMLESFAPEDKIADIREYPDVPGVDSWLTGSRFPEPIAEPIQLEWDPETAGPRKKIYDVTIPLYHKDVLAALHAAGVDNLDSYRVEVKHPKTGEITNDYWAVNIVGLVSAADLEKSKYTAHGQLLFDVDFDSLVIDPARARHAKFFRLAECVSGVVIHRTVKEQLEASGGFGLSFIPPEEWVG